MGEKLNHMLKEIILDQTDKKETTNKKLPVFEYRFHNYVITSDGHIFSLYNYKDMADNNGQVRLRIDGKLVSFSKKKLIYETCYNDFHMRYKEDFSGPVISYDEKIVFKDGNPNNCSIENLKVVNRYEKGKGAWQKRFTNTERELLIREYSKGNITQAALAKKFGTTTKTIRKYLGREKAKKYDKTYYDDIKATYHKHAQRGTGPTRIYKTMITTGSRVSCYTPEMEKRFRNIRKARSLSQPEMIALLGKEIGNIKVCSLSKYENGSRTPDFETIKKIEDKLKLDKGYLLFGDDEEVIKKYALKKKDLLKMNGKTVRLFSKDMSLPPRLVQVYVVKDDVLIQEPKKIKAKGLKDYKEYGNNDVFMMNLTYEYGKYKLS